LAGALALVSGVTGIAMVATLVAMYVGFALGSGARETALRIGMINDALAIVTYGLVLPVISTMHALVRETGGVRSLLLAMVGAVGIFVTMVLQWLLVTGALSFDQQIGMVTLSLLAVGVWMVGTGYLARRAGILPHGLRNGLLGAFYFGFPIWAIDTGRALLRAGRRPT
jgi:hypothetical protein